MKKVPLKKLPAPIIVLVRPQLAENIGMVARAMMNCGLSCLRLVNPREDPLAEKAISTSSGAREILEQAEIFDSLDSALADVHFALATTARERDMNKEILMPAKAVQKTDERICDGKKVAWIFGPERTGLENVDLKLSDALVQIPLNPLHSSLNLSQAVLIMGYTWWIRDLNEKNIAKNTKEVTKGELQIFLNRLDDILDEVGYYAFPEKKERMQRNLHNIFERNDLTKSELKTLYNVVTLLNRK